MSSKHQPPPADSSDDAADDRDTLRAPPREPSAEPLGEAARADQTPRMVQTLREDAFRSGVGQIRAPRDERDESTTLAPTTPGTYVAPEDEITRPIALPNARPAARPDARPPPLPSAIPAALGRGAEVHIPPLPVPKDMRKLMAMAGAPASERPAAAAIGADAFASSLSPAERGTPDDEVSRGRMMIMLALGAVVLLALGTSMLWRPSVQPVTRRPHDKLPRAAAAQGTDVPSAIAAAPAPSAEAAAPALASTDSPAPSPAPSALEPPAAARLRRAPAPEPATLPEEPSRQDVIGAMQPLREEIARCAEGRGGVAELMLNVDHTGAVVHARVVGDYAGTAQGSCIALAARKARFAPFQRERFSVRYPLAL